MRPDARRIRGSLAGVLALLVGLAALALAVRRARDGSGADAPGRSPDWEIAFYELRCEEIAREVVDGVLEPDEAGRVRLAGERAGLSVDGLAYVTRAAGRTLVLFVAWRSEAGFGGYVYASEPMEEGEALRLAGGRPGVRLVGPAGRGGGPAEVDAAVEFELEPHWYKVSAAAAD
jgi:hypothetical protein